MLAWQMVAWMKSSVEGGYHAPLQQDCLGMLLPMVLVMDDEERRERAVFDRDLRGELYSLAFVT